MKKKYELLVYYPAPNGTNDVEIYDENGEYVDTISECTFGIMDVDDEGSVVGIKKVLRHIAVSPVEDGTGQLFQLSLYFPEARKKLLKKIKDSDMGIILNHLNKTEYKGHGEAVTEELVLQVAKEKGLEIDLELATEIKDNAIYALGGRPDDGTPQVHIAILELEN